MMIASVPIADMSVSMRLKLIRTSAVCQGTLSLVHLAPNVWMNQDNPWPEVRYHESTVPYMPTPNEIRQPARLIISGHLHALSHDGCDKDATVQNVGIQAPRNSCESKLVIIIRNVSCCMRGLTDHDIRACVLDLPGEAVHRVAGREVVH